MLGLCEPDLLLTTPVFINLILLAISLVSTNHRRPQDMIHRSLGREIDSGNTLFRRTVFVYSS